MWYITDTCEQKTLEPFWTLEPFYRGNQLVTSVLGSFLVIKVCQVISRAVHYQAEINIWSIKFLLLPVLTVHYLSTSIHRCDVLNSHISWTSTHCTAVATCYVRIEAPRVSSQDVSLRLLHLPTCLRGGLPSP